MASPILVEREERLVASPKRAAILEAAIAEFLASGFDGASMDRIAARAGVSKQTIYAHFSSKDGLVQAIARESLLLPEEDSLRYDPEAPLDAQLTRVAESVLRVLTSDHYVALVRIIVGREVRDPQGSGPVASEARERFTASIVEWVEAAVRDGRLEVEDPWLAVSQFLGSLQSAAFWPLVLGSRRLSPEKQDQLLTSSVAMFLDHYAKR
jgi:TetR/AcrR family transcriptional regulator of autoinduction and epiphytic fitness